MNSLETLVVPFLLAVLLLGPLAMIYARDLRQRTAVRRSAQEMSPAAQALTLELSRQLMECQTGRQAVMAKLTQMREKLGQLDQDLREEKQRRESESASHAAELASLRGTIVAMAQGGVSHVMPRRGRGGVTTGQGGTGTPGGGTRANKDEQGQTRANRGRMDGMDAQTRRTMEQELAAARRNLALLELEQTEKGSDVYRTNQIEAMKGRIRELEQALDEAGRTEKRQDSKARASDE